MHTQSDKSMHSAALAVAPCRERLRGGPVHLTAGNFSLLFSVLNDGEYRAQEDEKFQIVITQPVRFCATRSPGRYVMINV